jgi:hypothetical protein
LDSPLSWCVGHQGVPGTLNSDTSVIPPRFTHGRSNLRGCVSCVPSLKGCDQPKGSLGGLHPMEVKRLGKVFLHLECEAPLPQALMFRPTLWWKCEHFFMSRLLP